MEFQFDFKMALEYIFPGMNSNNNVWNRSTAVETSNYNWNDDPYLRKGDDTLLSKERFKIVDLFCGCGGFSVGFELAGFQTVLATDIHVPSINTFAKNHPWTNLIVGNMQIVKEGMILDSLSGNKVHIVAAGVPCQGFSLNNRKRWIHDKRNFLFREFIRVIKLINSPIVLLENVSGLVSSAQGTFKVAIAESIQECGYKLESIMLNALDYGVPQRRNRVFFLGVKPDLEIHWPAPSHGSHRPYEHVSVWDAIGDLPQVEPGEKCSNYDKDPMTEYQKWARKNSKVLWNHEAPNHPLATINKIGSTPPSDPIYPKFKQRIRLHPDRPSPTQVSGGIRPQYQFGHPKLPRGLTVRERCRIQSFPDRYYICGGTVQGRVQTGNAVPPLLARAIAEQISGMLKGEPRTEKTLPKEPAQMVLI